MTLREFIKLDTLKLPFASSQNFRVELRNKFLEFTENIVKVDSEYSHVIEKHLQNAKDNFEDVDQVISLVLSGNSIKAFEKFSILIERLLYFMSPDKNFIRPKKSDKDFLFRARVTNNSFLTTLDLFHRPFEQRFKIPNSRFSLNGMPCLYLSNSTYTCWEECRRPELSKTYFSRFNANSELETLDFSYEFEPLVTLSNILKVSETLDAVMKLLISVKLAESIEKFMNLFPLYLASYTSTYGADNVFKPEYIFPQFIMQWIISTNKYDGVKYNSTKCFAHRAFPNSYFGLYNFAYPAKTSRETGYCEFLLNKFTLTKPVSWELLTLTEPGWYLMEKQLLKYPVDKIALVEDQQVAYHKTAFGKIESVLFDMNLENSFN